MKYTDIDNYILESIKYNVISMEEWDNADDYEDLGILDVDESDLLLNTSLFNPSHLGNLGNEIVDIIHDGNILFSGTKDEVDQWINDNYKNITGTLLFSLKGAVIHTMNLANNV